MKRFLLVLLLAPFAFSQVGSTITILTSVVCGAQPAIIAWTGTNFICATLGQGLSLSPTGVLSVTATQTVAAVPVWQLDTIPLTGTPVGSTSILHSTVRPMIPGSLILWYYNRQDTTGFPSAGAINNATNPVTFTLPRGWAQSDTITMAYLSPPQP